MTLVVSVCREHVSKWRTITVILVSWVYEQGPITEARIVLQKMFLTFRPVHICTNLQILSCLHDVLKHLVTKMRADIFPKYEHF